MDNPNLIKPCLVETPQGFTISYQEKFLYSKYNPSRLILQHIENLQLLPGTIILCCSPVLPYGLEELKSKLPQDCIMIICEFDEELRKFEKETLSQIQNIIIPETKELYNLPLLLNENQYTFNCGIQLPKTGYFKRAIRLDFSAGTQFHQSLYNELLDSCTNSIMTFWSNRVTLTKFGRRYSQNFFRNIKILSDTTPINSYFNSITKPIIICGAGQSLNSVINFLQKNQKDFFILCADTALQPLLKAGITPYGVFIEEAQAVIAKAFIGTQKFNFHIFAGLSSLPQISHIIQSKNISFFTTQYANVDFFDVARRMDILPPVNRPFGSVGLTTVYYALKFRQSEDIPVYVYGLDFSYSSGITHAKETLAHRLRLISNNRILPVQNYGASFSKFTHSFLDKSNNIFYTTPTLQNYANMFNSLFYNTKNLFDATQCGIPLEIERKTPIIQKNNSEEEINITEYSDETKAQIKRYLKDESEALIKLRDILTGILPLSKEEQEIEIKKIASSREYLFLHFPDGWQFNYNLSFLKRIRTEIDFFLKWML